jgi:hypothetical protein
VDCDILAQGLIGLILIPPSYTFFSESPPVKNSEVKRVRMDDRPESFPGCAQVRTNVHRKD